MGQERRAVKTLTVFLVFLLVLGMAGPAAAGDVIYEEIISEPVGRGASYQQTWRFTRDGWLRFHVLEVDLTDPEVELELLYNGEELAKPRPLTELAAERGAVAAVNGDFFYQQGSYTAPVGPMSQGGRLVASPGTDTGMGVIALTPDGRVELGSWQGEGYVENPTGDAFRLAGVNKPGSDYAWPILYTPDWGKKSPATPPGVVTLIGIDSMVVRVSEEGEQEIPSGEGFVLVAGGTAADYFRSLGTTDPIEFSYTTTPDWQNYLTAMGGGAILLRDGRIVPEGHQVEGRHPRSAAGVSADGKTLYLVAVDGRQDASRGLEQVELAQFLLDLGAADAINLDGGGSTTLVTRPLGADQPVVRNSVAGSGQRSIPNGLGVFTADSAGPAAGLVLSVADENIPLEGTRSLTLRAYDDNYNPVSLPAGVPTWEVLPGDLGRVADGVFYPQRTGPGKIQVRMGTMEAEVDIRVIGPAVELSITPERVNLEPGVQQAFAVTGVDSRGYRALVEPGDLDWEVRGGIGTLEKGRLAAAGSAGTGAVLARLDAVETGALVTVGREEVPLKRLESPGGVSFLSAPQGIPGGISFKRAQEPLPTREGAVLALKYDLTPVEGATRAAYVVLGDEGLQLHPQAQSVGLWVYGDDSGHWLRGSVEDDAGEQTPLDFARHIDWEGWRYVRANLPAGAAKPLTLKRVYLAEPDSARGGVGTLYLADLQLELPLAWSAGLLPEVVTGEDPAQMADGEEGPAGDKLLVVGNIDTGVDQAALAEALMTEKERRGAAHILTTGPLPLPEDPAAAEGEGSLSLLPRGHLPTAFRQDGFYSLYLRAAQGGLRETDFHQWEYLQQESALVPAGSPLFVFLDRAPFKGDVPGLGFNNSAEAELFRKHLTAHQEGQGGEVWVFCGGAPAGTEPWWRLEEGVRYLGLPPVTEATAFDYLVVSLGPDGPVYSRQAYRQ